MRPLVNARASGGFSLLELIVALAIFGMAVVGLLNLSGESTRTVVVLEERALAAVVAENQAIEATLARLRQSVRLRTGR